MYRCAGFDLSSDVQEAVCLRTRQGMRQKIRDRGEDMAVDWLFEARQGRGSRAKDEARRCFKAIVVLVNIVSLLSLIHI